MRSHPPQARPYLNQKTLIDASVGLAPGQSPARKASVRRGGRVAEGAPLLREYGFIAHRGFESHPLRHAVCYISGYFRVSELMPYFPGLVQEIRDNLISITL